MNHLPNQTLHSGHHVMSQGEVEVVHTMAQVGVIWKHFQVRMFNLSHVSRLQATLLYLKFEAPAGVPPPPTGTGASQTVC